MHSKENSHPEPNDVVIVGGGFAGLRRTVELAAYRSVRITLIDRNNYQQFHPLLYQVAASMLSTGIAAFALRDILRDDANLDVQMGEVTSVDRTLGAWPSYSSTYRQLVSPCQRNSRPITGINQVLHVVALQQFIL